MPFFMRVIWHFIQKSSQKTVAKTGIIVPIFHIKKQKFYAHRKI